MLNLGVQLTEEETVAQNHTAKNVGSGGLDVLATPVLMALMEKAAWKSVLPYLENGTDTVGTFIEMHHISPTPVGTKISATSTLTHINNRELTFQISACDSIGEIATATHKRIIIHKEKFQQKADEKLKQVES